MGSVHSGSNSGQPMAFFRQYIAPLFIVLIFLVALLATSARIFLPADMAQPAPTESNVSPQAQVQRSLPPWAHA